RLLRYRLASLWRSIRGVVVCVVLARGLNPNIAGGVILDDVERRIHRRWQIAAPDKRGEVAGISRRAPWCWWRWTRVLLIFVGHHGNLDHLEVDDTLGIEHISSRF